MSAARPFKARRRATMWPGDGPGMAGEAEPWSAGSATYITSKGGKIIPPTGVRATHERDI